MPLTRQLAERLHARSGLSSPDELVFVDERRQVDAASTPDVTGTTELVPGRVETSLIGDDEYRAIGSRLVPRRAP